MSAECHQCGHDMGYGPMGVPTCVWCEIVNERNRYRDACIAAYSELTDENTLGPVTVAEAVERAREFLAEPLARPA